MEIGASITFPSGSGLTKSGHTFFGWGTSLSGSYRSLDPYKISKNTSFYAKWTPYSSDTPTGVAATATSSDSIRVSWNPVSGAMSYYVYRCSGSPFGNYQQVGTVGTATSYTDTGLSAETSYYYEVSSFSSTKGESGKSSFVYARTLGEVPGIGSYAMVYVPGGSFEMGKDLGTAATGDVEPVHTVTLSSFYMGKYEVTQSQWQAVMGTTIEQQQALTTNPYSYGKGDAYPIYFVSWYDAIEFCNALSVLEGLTPYYTINKEQIDPNNRNINDTFKWLVTPNTTATGYRLPTEAQWEYAAKGGDPTAEDWVGYTYAGSDNPDEVAWHYWRETNGDTVYARAVGTKASNRLGIHDMSGNVLEWCWDWFGSYSSEVQTNPIGLSSGYNRVLRGGSWNNFSNAHGSSVYQISYDPILRNSNIGFRVARPAQ